MRLFLLLILFLLIFAPVQAEPTRTYTGKKANTNLSGETEQPAETSGDENVDTVQPTEQPDTGA